MCKTDNITQTMLLPNGDPITFGNHSHIMGIINLTDDSFFSDSRTYDSKSATLERALKLTREGASILDLGAESTRPGSSRVSEEQEIERMTEAVKIIRHNLPNIPISIDTTRSTVAQAALDQGADIINDISGLTFDEKIADIASQYNAPLVIMHMRGTPKTMQSMCQYDNILDDISSFFEKSIEKAVSKGVPRKNIILDPGFGFAKTTEQNLYLVKHTEAFKTFKMPLLYGVSRKGFIGRTTHGDPMPGESLQGTIATTTLFATAGIDIIRVHDVLDNIRAIKIAEAVKNAQP